MDKYVYYYVSIAIIYALILLAFGLVLYRWKHIRHTREWIFLPFLSFTILMEILSQYVVWGLGVNPSAVIDIYTLGAMFFAIYWFYLYLELKWLGISSAMLMTASYFIGLSRLDVYTYELPALVIAAALTITVTVFIFFNQLLRKDAIQRFKAHRPFWIAIGFFVFHINAMPYVLFLPNLSRLTWQVSGVLIFFNLMMYGCFIYAFCLKKPVYE
ncbi:hypothetical protein [Nonlabens xiamenensis]|uniref:hypothetical protein n=1 Tax=Nonlabens xiamenensis TaxID=2341043 RepID=UPI000F60F8E0|nr:hypothetical protein [Nonlabens xiamenensis]